MRVLLDEQQGVGGHRVVWNSRDGAGRPVPPGTYYYTIESNGSGETGTIVLVR
jgi:flagellar hook assembly protein FlgD